MFEGFDEFDLGTTGTTIHGRRGGHHPTILLLHGVPETRGGPISAGHFIAEEAPDETVGRLLDFLA
ncbi:MAG TPA: hypothetical protein VHI50_02050 [Micromonosporaceae bacterium]|nr:hypothetical protein [Micromonosporaceae bacterium]